MNENFQKARELFFQGVADFEAGRFEAARGKFESSLALVPGRGSTLTNLAATHIKLSRPEAALGFLEQALAAEPDDTEALWQRGIALSDLGRHEPALDAFERLLALRPAHSEAWMLHGQTLQHLERHAQAMPSYDKALAIDPGLAQAWTNQGNILKDMGRLDEAAAAFRQAIAAGGNAEVNAYFLAAVATRADGQPSPLAAPALYVRSLFDSYADSFDTHLVQVLHYQAHTVLVNGLQGLQGLNGNRFRRALDLGCGTGLCGPLAGPLVDHIDGVDLSPNMLAKAAELKVYRKLAQSDMVAFLQTAEQTYDLVLAADVFIYVGDLGPVFRAVASVMEGGGIFCFSAETPEGDKDFELKTSLRYGHSEAYLRALAGRHGFDVVTVLRQPIREDQRQAIAGQYWYLRRRY